MSVTLPTISVSGSGIYTGEVNSKGLLCNNYSPLLNLTEETTNKLTDFTTDKLNFDLEHPVDIELQDSYDGSVNMILNDGKNKPKLIGSRFSVQDENTFKITDHTGFKDTNIYDEKTFDVDTNIKAIPHRIPTISYEGLIDNGGAMPCGSYVFYFKLSDADGNETEVIAESGIVQCHIGAVNTPNSIRMGLEDENSMKAIKFKITNIDTGFDYIHVFYSRASSSKDLATVTRYSKVIFDYPISPLSDSEGICDITITGKENILESSKDEITIDFADINAVKTQTVCDKVLLFGNVESNEHDWDAIKRFTWKIIPYVELLPAGSIGSLSEDYNSTNSLDSDTSSCYYNTKNVYYRVGYWPDEIYRFGIVYIFDDNSLSRVINLQGIDFTTILDKDSIFYSRAQKDWPSDYEQLFFTEPETDNLTRCPEYLYETDSLYFNKKYRTNSRGVFKFPLKLNHIPIDIINMSNGTMTPKPLYIKFDLSLIGYKYAKPPTTTTIQDGECEDWESVLKKHHIKGYFFVRLKRIPTILGLGLIIGHTDKDRGALPVIKNTENKYVVQPFLTTLRLLNSIAEELAFTGSQFDNQAMLVPDAEINEATFNTLFSSTDYALIATGDSSFNYENSTASLLTFNVKESNSIYKTKLTNIPEDTKILTNGTDYFSTLAGNPDEPYKTKDIVNIWNKTLPQDLTKSTSLLRGKWGTYVGLSNPNALNSDASCPFQYGEIYNIKKANYSTQPDAAVDLDFQASLNSTSYFYAISPRQEYSQTCDCFRGDCYPSLFTHRMFRNFIDTELPTNTEIVDPACWSKNYGVKCTASILTTAHSNLTKDDEGWYITTNADKRREHAILNAVMSVLLLNPFSFITALIQAKKSIDPTTTSPGSFGLSDSYVKYEHGNGWFTGDYVSGEFDWSILGWKRKQGCEVNTPTNCPSSLPLEDTYYLLDYYDVNTDSGSTSYGKLTPTLATDDNGDYIIFDSTNLDLIYPNGFSHEIVQAFEVYKGKESLSIADFLNPLTGIIKAIKWGTSGDDPLRKKLDPERQESELKKGLSLKSIFKADDEWELRGLAAINRADVNAVAMGQWITFPVLSNNNLAMRDIDFSNATEEAAFNRKRSFYPLAAKDKHCPLPDSNVINGAARQSIPTREYYPLEKLPYYKLEYFTRIYNSFKDTAGSVSNEFKMILQSCYHDYEKLYGSITKLVSLGGNVFVIFKHGIGMLPLSQSIALSQTAQTFLPPISIISDTYGSIWKDSIIKTDYNIIYGVDSVAKVIWAIIGNQVTPISTMKVGKFLVDNLDMSEFVFRPYVGHINIKTHYNAFKGDVMFTYYNDSLYDMTLSDYTGDDFGVDKYNYITYKNERLAENIKATQLLPYYDATKQGWITWEELIANHPTCKWIKGNTWSLCYNENSKHFETFYDWTPLESANIDNIYFSFDKDGIDSLSDNYKNAIITPKFGHYTTAGDFEEMTIDTETVKLGINYKKNMVDNTFTDSTVVYKVKSNYGVTNITDTSGVITSVPGINKCKLNISTTVLENTCGVFSMYYKPELNNKIHLFVYTSSGNKLYDSWFTSDSEGRWKFLVLYMQPLNPHTSLDIGYIIIDNVETSSNPGAVTTYHTYSICEPKFNIDTTLEMPSEYTIKDLTKDDNGFFNDCYDIRNSNNSLLLWKHGQAGVYDNQGVIKPTNWYGKQHEFNFEFIVNDKAQIQKVFNNIKLISNKTAPNKFEYEVVGEGYDWFKYKPLIVWINNHYQDEKVFTSISWSNYFKAATNQLKFDFLYWYIMTLTYNSLCTTLYQYDFPQDLPFKDNQIIEKIPYLKLELTDRKGRKDRSYHLTDAWTGLPSSGGTQNKYSFNCSEPVLVEDTQLNEIRIHTESLGNDMNKVGRIRGNMQYLEDLWDIEIRPIQLKWAYPKRDTSGTIIEPIVIQTAIETWEIYQDLELLYKKTETRHRDKYIKIKFRYTGENLALIQALSTSFDLSYA